MADQYQSPPDESPPPYGDQSTQSATVSQDLTAAFSNLHLADRTAKPTADQCLAHLKLLEAFHQLREDVATTDGLFGLQDSLVSADSTGSTEQERAELLLKIREKRWAIYVTKAAQRYETWWQICVEGSGMPKCAELLQAFRDIESAGSIIRFNKDNIPPLGTERLHMLL